MTSKTPASPSAHERKDLTLSHLNFPVVGIGASAGGLQAIKLFFEHMPKDSGMAFVIILHLSPDHQSIADQIIQESTRMPVLQVTQPVPIEQLAVERHRLVRVAHQPAQPSVLPEPELGAGGPAVAPDCGEGRRDLGTAGHPRSAPASGLRNATALS